MEEIWKEVIGYKGFYLVSNLGRIKNCKGKFLKQHFYNNYYSVLLSNKGKRKKHLTHRIVATAFIDNPHNYKYINHMDENTKNNSADNLEWCTAKYNCNYGNHNIKMSNTKKIPISQVSKNGEIIKIWRSAKDVEDTLKIKRSNICKCCKGERKTAGGFAWKFEKRERRNDNRDNRL